MGLQFEATYLFFNFLQILFLCSIKIRANTKIIQSSSLQKSVEIITILSHWLFLKS